MAELRDANTNPWYVLMTLYDGESGWSDEKIDLENRRTWNAWATQHDLSLLDRTAESLGNRCPSRDHWAENGAEIRKLHKLKFDTLNHGKVDYVGFPDALEPVDFSDTLFQSDLDISALLFPKFVNFNGSKFNNLNMILACFLGQVDARRITVFGATLLFGAKFFENANFSDSDLQGDVDADNVVFNLPKEPIGKEDWQKIFWEVNPNFNRASFGGKAQFRSAIFEGHAVFIELKVVNGIEFNASKFLRDADFRRANFEKITSFHAVKFSEKADFSEVQFGGQTLFSLAEFNGSAILFRYVSFHKPSSFQKAVFAQNYPMFDGVLLNQTTIFSASNDFWPKVAFEGSSRSKDSCARIRHALAQQGLPEDEHFFFRREMGFAAQIGGWWQRLPYRAFGLLSNFGESIARPLIGLGVAFVTFAVVFSAYFNWMNEFYDKAFSGAAPFTLSGSNLFSFLGFHRFYFESLKFAEMHWIVQLLCAIEVLLGLVLLFFLGLALRKRFRLR